jgi:hypothetical protein
MRSGPIRGAEWNDRAELIARFVVTLLLLLTLLVADKSTPGLAGVVVGLVAGHWLPSPRKLRTGDPGRDAKLDG